MGQKINYSKKNKKLKVVIIVALAVVSLLILYISFKEAIKSIRNNETPNTTESSQIKYSVGSYSTIESLLASHNCKLIKEAKESGQTILYVNFTYDLYTGNVSNENYFFNISKLVAEFYNYINFEIIDNKKNIDIEVTCEKPNIVEFKINGDVNYYLNQDTIRNSSNRQNRVTSFTIQSKELQAAIEGNWNEANVDWGTKESTCDGYNIYFDEGIKYKVVARNIYNIIFTRQYKGEVAGNLNPNSSKEAVVNNLGEPTFSNGDMLYGYIGENNYIFFDFINKQISIYPVVKISNSEESNLKVLINQMNKTSDIKNFVTELVNAWNDYDVYDFNSDYVDLRYTLKGIKLDISASSLKNGIFIYQNYSGDTNITELENVYFTDTDMVFDEEKVRTSNESLNRNIQGYFSDEEINKILGKNFLIRFKSFEDSICIGPMFYSKSQEYADSELDKNLEVSSYRWYNDSILVYSVNNDGIYVYNCETRVNAKALDLNGEITIQDAGNGQIIYNNNEILNVVIE